MGRKSPSTEMNGHSFLRRPGPTRGCRANDDDDDDDEWLDRFIRKRILFI
jgi:hypothetical protein